MTTLFDIGDKIKLTLEGTIKSFSISENGDCYVINLKNAEGKGATQVYLDSNALLDSNARKA